MGSPLAQNPDVQRVIQAITDRDIEWLESIYDKPSPKPAQLMFACASVLGDGGQEEIAVMMRAVPAKQRRGKFVDLCIKLATAPNEEVPTEEVVVEEVVEVAPKKKRRRRTKAQIEADKAAEAAAIAQEEKELRAGVDLEKDASDWGKTMDLIREIAKTMFSVEERLEKLENSVKSLDELSKSGAKDLEASTILTSMMLTSIKEGLCAAELELVMSGKLGTAAISDTIEEKWPVKDDNDDMPF